MAHRNPARSSTAPTARSRPAQARSPDDIAQALQRTVGNRGMAQVLARKDKGKGTKKNAAQFEKKVMVGDLGPIEIKESNIDSWLSKKGGDENLVLTTTSGDHSEELKRLADSRTKIDKLEVVVVQGQNTQVTVEFEHVRIKGYEASDKTESWKAVDFDNVHIKRVSIGSARP
jgi:hypothetical protein